VRRIVLPAEPLVDGPTALRPWRDSDDIAIAVACQDPEIVRWTNVPANYTERDARLYLLERWDAIHSGTRAPFAIVAADDLAHLLGSVSLMRFDWDHARGEVGYWLARTARGEGHATRAVRLICRWGFRTLGLQRIELLAGLANGPSQQVAVRAGFTREAILRSYLDAKDGRLDTVAFSLLASDPGALSGPQAR
jgi:RimJ/RimL family protein N-acetyltransferase